MSMSLNTPTPGSRVICTIVTMKNRLALAIALTVAVFSFLNLSSGWGSVYYDNGLTDVFKEVIVDRIQMRSLRRNVRPHPDDYTEIINNNGNHRSLRQTLPYFDPKTVSAKESTPFIIPEANLAATRHAVPTVTRNRLPLQGSTVVDIVSIGSNTRPYFLTTQRDTWANHDSVRNFWGVTEEQDYDANCATGTSEVYQKEFMNLCWPGGSQREYKGWGWYCAQRRPGHALGWLQTMYQDPANIPDMLIIVDDDTSVDINFAIHQMSLVVDNRAPYVGNPCVFPQSRSGLGGMGTFFNRVAIEGLTRPNFCNHHQQQEGSMNTVCEGLIAKTSINAELFQQGDSVFDIFYKYSAVHKFCQHSDGVMAQMINGYTEFTGGLIQFGQCNSRSCPTSGTISCHYQQPDKMKQFALDRNVTSVYHIER